MYPLPANFRSGDPAVDSFDAWWSYRRDDGTQYQCATSGAAVLQDVAGALGLGSGYRAWDARLLGALGTQAGRDAAASGAMDAWRPLLAAIGSAQASGTTLPPEVLAYALWVAYYYGSGLRLDGIAIPSGSVLPVVGMPVPGRSQRLACWIEGATEPVAGLSASALEQARSETVDGIRLRAGETPPEPLAPPPPPSGLGTAQVGLIVLGIAAFAGVAFWAIGRAQKSKP